MPVTVTLPEMTRFLLTLDRAVDTVFAALGGARPGEIYVPRVPAARVVDLAAALIGDRDIPITFTGIRPGEKVHEIMVSEEECYRTIARGAYYVICPMLPECGVEMDGAQALTAEYLIRGRHARPGWPSRACRIDVRHARIEIARGPVFW